MKFLIGRQQRNILMMAGIVALSVSVFFVFIYMPKHVQMQNLRQELAGIEKSLDNINLIVGDTKNLGKGILKLREKAASLQAKFIKADETADFLNMLSENADQFDIEIVSMQPSGAKTYYGAKGEVLQLENLECNKISIDMIVNGTYKALVDYMRALEHQEALQLIIRRFEIEKQQQPARLRIHMVIDVFTLLPKPGAK